MLRCGYRGAGFDGKEHDYFVDRTSGANRTLLGYRRIPESHWKSLVRIRRLLRVVMVGYVALRAQGHVGEEIRQGQGPYGEHGYLAGDHLQ